MVKDAGCSYKCGRLATRTGVRPDLCDQCWHQEQTLTSESIKRAGERLEKLKQNGTQH